MRGLLIFSSRTADKYEGLLFPDRLSRSTPFPSSKSLSRTTSTQRHDTLPVILTARSNVWILFEIGISRQGGHLAKQEVLAREATGQQCHGYLDILEKGFATGEIGCCSGVPFLAGCLEIFRRKLQRSFGLGHGSATSQIHFPAPGAELMLKVRY